MPIYALGECKPKLPPEGEYWIAPNAVLIGKVLLKKNASVWWGAVLRGDNEWITVGEGTNVQDLCVVHADAGEPVSIGSNVTVGHRVIIHSAEIGDGSLIGMGSVLLNRARIGRNCLVGANSLITEDKQFDDGNMILGSPARVRCGLTDAQIEDLGRSSYGYADKALRYAAKLTKIS
jgi:carbonic anhydrase/acetyltransferase-like protein (isoleucine patch superfamily)